MPYTESSTISHLKVLATVAICYLPLKDNDSNSAPLTGKCIVSQPLVRLVMYSNKAFSAVPICLSGRST